MHICVKIQENTYTVLLLTGSVVIMHNEIKVLFPLVRVMLGAIEYDGPQQ